jgi:hypothetical protein
MRLNAVMITPISTDEHHVFELGDQAESRLEFGYPDRPDIPSNIILGEN